MIPETQRPPASEDASSASHGEFETCFSPREVDVLGGILRARDTLSVKGAEELRTCFDRWIYGLSRLIEAIDSCPSVRASEELAGRSRDLETLIDSLCRSDSRAGLDLVLPTRAILGQAYLQSKINFFKAISYVLADSGSDGLLEKVESIFEDAIHTKLAEELLIACVTNTANPLDLKKAAAGLLLPMWEERKLVPVEGFTKLLFSAWRARCGVHETFGTLVGVQEVFSLLRAECEPSFLDYFTRSRVKADETEAFREFLFALPYEHLEKLRHYMEENNVRVIGPNDVWRILGQTQPSKPALTLNAESIYTSYRRRRIRADYRTLNEAPGPRKTAEGYLMEYYLLGEDSLLDDDSPSE